MTFAKEGEAIGRGMRPIAGVDFQGVVEEVVAMFGLSQTESQFDAVVVTVCTRERQLERLRARGLTLQEAELRLAAQMSATDKAARADYVITTDGPKADTDEQVVRLLHALASAGS